MKISIKSLLGFLVLCLFFASCKKEELTSLKDITNNNSEDVSEKSSEGIPNINQGRVSIEVISQNLSEYKLKVSYAPLPSMNVTKTLWTFKNRRTTIQEELIKSETTFNGSTSLEVTIPYNSVDGLNILNIEIGSFNQNGAITDFIKDYQVLKATTDLSPVFEYYSESGRDHYYTLTRYLDGNSYWGGTINSTPGFSAFTNYYSGRVPVYGYYNSSNRDHALSLNPNLNVSGFNNGGIQFYAYSNQVSGSIPIYQYYNSGLTDHCYVTNPSTMTPWLSKGWAYQGVAFYAMPVTNQ